MNWDFGKWTWIIIEMGKPRLFFDSGPGDIPMDFISNLYGVLRTPYSITFL